MRISEIAARLRLSRSAVEVRLFRARRRLRTEYLRREAGLPVFALSAGFRTLSARLLGTLSGAPSLPAAGLVTAVTLAGVVAGVSHRGSTTVGHRHSAASVVRVLRQPAGYLPRRSPLFVARAAAPAVRRGLRLAPLRRRWHPKVQRHAGRQRARGVANPPVLVHIPRAGPMHLHRRRRSSSAATRLSGPVYSPSGPVPTARAAHTSGSRDLIRVRGHAFVSRRRLVSAVAPAAFSTVLPVAVHSRARSSSSRRIGLTRMHSRANHQFPPHPRRAIWYGGTARQTASRAAVRRERSGARQLGGGKKTADAGPVSTLPARRSRGAPVQSAPSTIRSHGSSRSAAPPVVPSDPTPLPSASPATPSPTAFTRTLPVTAHGGNRSGQPIPTVVSLSPPPTVQPTTASGCVSTHGGGCSHRP